MPFERLVELKGIIEKRRRWSRTRGGEGKTHHFEIRWKPKSWARKARILCIRTMRRIQRKGPLQLDLFGSSAESVGEIPDLLRERWTPGPAAPGPQNC